MAQIVGTESDARARAGFEFDQKPGIDGTISWELERETTAQRNYRRKTWVDLQVCAWRTASPAEKIQQAIDNKNHPLKLVDYKNLPIAAPKHEPLYYL